MDVMNQRPMTAKEVIEHNNEILRSIALTPDQREEYGKICSVIDNNNVCLAAWAREDMEQTAKDEAVDDAPKVEDIQEVKEDAVPEAE